MLDLADFSGAGSILMCVGLLGKLDLMEMLLRLSIYLKMKYIIVHPLQQGSNFHDAKYSGCMLPAMRL